MSQPIETSVVIIGGSIVGLVQAMLLAKQRIPFILIERHTGSSPHPRAIGYTHRTLEIFRSVGIDKDMPPPAPGMGKPRRVKAETLNGEWMGEIEWTKQDGQSNPSPQGKAPGGPRGGPPDMSSISPVGHTAIAQDKLEPIIRNKALQLGAELRLGCKMTEWSQDSDGVSVTAIDSDGKSFSVRAKYMIACDGAGSRIRKDLGISGTGVGHLRTLRSIMFRCPSIEHHLSRGISQWSIENGDFEGFLMTFRDGRWALMSYNASADALDEEGQKTLIRKAIGENYDDIELVTQGKWDLSASIADKFSSGRVFLAGDAAHTLPPSRGGYGANTGIHDAHNLAWKLAAVLSGKSDPSVLDTYDQERRPVALVRHDQIFARDDYKAYVGNTDWEKNNKPADIIDDVAMELGQLYRSSGIIGSEDQTLPLAQTPAQWKGHPGTRAPHIKLTYGGEKISSLDLFDHWVVLSKSDDWKATLGDASDVQLVQIGKDAQEVSEGSFVDSFGVTDHGAVLVRPDGHVAARWTDSIASDDFGVTLKKVAHLA
ncbi:FAD binding domain-containing protein [Xylariales sp. AK1849]|nr:FAD binding domain-containing protein [Xylariales sp. AK1849]